MAQNITISSSKDIRDFALKLTADTPMPEITIFLKALGKKLKSSNRHNMPPDLIGDTESLILKLQEIFTDKSLKPKTEDLLFDIVGFVQELTQETEVEDKLKANFYAGVPKLGSKIITLAGYLGTAVIPIVTTSSVLLN